MQPVERHPFAADVSFDGGDLDCGNGLLLLIRQHMDPMARGQLLEFRSTEISVDEDFPAWCRMTGNELVSFVRRGTQRSFLVCKGTLVERVASAAPARRVRVAPVGRGVHSDHAAATRARAGGRVAVGHGHRELAPAALDAPGPSRASRGAAW